MGRSIPQLLQYAFMAWCSLKAQGQLYFYLNLYLYYVNIRFRNPTKFKYLRTTVTRRKSKLCRNRL